ncbi:hypothetical protein EJ110_NYTH60024 [Nymphaea thermarum]|nr:hypothetical protein EJ110_NYTH60024 [Nymphaea thermarum]
MYLEKVAIEWYCFWEEDFPNATWDFFKEELLLRFGDTTYVNHEIELRNLKQTSSVQEYQTKFERLSSMVKNRPVESKIAHFIGGLNEDIQIEMLRDPPTELRRCFALAKVGADAGAVKNPREVNSQPPPTASTKKSGDLDCEAKSSTFTKEINKAPSRDCVKNSREVVEPVHMEDLGGLGLGILDPPGLGGEDPSAPCLEDEDLNLPSSDEEGLGAMDLGDGGLGLEGRTGDPENSLSSSRVETLRDGDRKLPPDEPATSSSSLVQSLQPWERLEVKEARGTVGKIGAFSRSKDGGLRPFNSRTSDHRRSLLERQAIPIPIAWRRRHRVHLHYNLNVGGGLVSVEAILRLNRNNILNFESDRTSAHRSTLPSKLTVAVAAAQTLNSANILRNNIVKVGCDRIRAHWPNLPRNIAVSVTAVLSQSTTEPPLAEAISHDSGTSAEGAQMRREANDFSFEFCAKQVAETTGALQNPREVNSQPFSTASTKESGDILSEAKSSTTKAEINKAPSRASVENPGEAKNASRAKDLERLNLGDLDILGLGGEDPSAPCLENEEPNLPSLDEEDLGIMDLGDGGLGLEGRTGDPGLDQG